MKTKNSYVQKLVRKAAQIVVHREREGWPPDTLWSAYQPKRPEDMNFASQKKDRKSDHQ